MAKNNWTRRELLAAFNLYCKTPFTKINSSNKAVKNLAATIGRTDGAVAMKLANFARLDPVLQARGVKGLKGGSKQEEEIWKEFNSDWEELAFQSEMALSEYTHRPLEDSADTDSDFSKFDGMEREVLLRVRVNQSFFRRTVLASYDNRCCITGVSEPQLLIASHIIPWKERVSTRVHPGNGLCLNSLHDKAFDKGLFTIDDEYNVVLSNRLKEMIKSEWYGQFFAPIDGKKITLPQKFLPEKEFIKYHQRNIFKY